MRGALQRQIDEARETERTLVQGSARLCSRKFGRAWKGIFPHKAAEELAVRASCSVRAAAYEIAGERAPGARSIAALIAACLERD